MAPLFTERAATSICVKDSRDGRNTITKHSRKRRLEMVHIGTPWKNLCIESNLIKVMVLSER